MPILIACLSTGKGTWSLVSQSFKENWDKIILISTQFAKEKFTTYPKNTEFIIINPDDDIKDIKAQLVKELKPKLKAEIALNIISGTGKEHTALISALLNLGAPIKLIAVTKQGIEEI